MSFLLICVGLCVISCIAESINYEAKIEESTLAKAAGMKMELTISDNDDLIELILTGPSSLYYSIGIGSCDMSSTWSIVLQGSSEDSTPFERLLGSNSAGRLIDNSFDVIDDNIDGFLRTVKLQRKISKLSSMDNDYYDLTTNDDYIDVIWAYGNRARFSNHGSEQRGCTSLTYIKNEQESIAMFNWQSLFSNNSSYLFGQSPSSVIVVLILLTSVMIYGIFRYCIKTKTKIKKEIIYKNNNNNDNDYDELQTLLDDDQITKYVAI